MQGAWEGEVDIFRSDLTQQQLHMGAHKRDRILRF